MHNIDLTLQLLSLLALLLYLTPRAFSGKISARSAQRFWRGGIALWAVGMLIAVGASIRWLLQ